MWMVVDRKKATKAIHSRQNSPIPQVTWYTATYTCGSSLDLSPPIVSREWCRWGGKYAWKRVPRGNDQSGTKGGAKSSSSILFHALTLTSADTPKKPRWRKSSGDPGERMPSACPVRPITFFPSRYESMAVRGFERCRNEGCEEGLILFYCTIWTTYHGVIYHAYEECLLSRSIVAAIRYY